MTAPLLTARGLEIIFKGRDVPVVSGLDLDIRPGETLAVVGPSGCGKSLTARALCGLLPASARWGGEILWQGTPLTDPDDARWSALRGPGLTLILQEPLAALNPVLTVGAQVEETLRVRAGLSRRAARARARELFAEVHLPHPDRVGQAYPHQLSGGMRQRVLLAAALACDPRLLIADEPTASLDLTVQREILALLDRIRRERNLALLFVTHDLSLVPLLAERALVMGEGTPPRLVAATDLAVDNPAPPGRSTAPEGTPVLSVRGLQVRYGPDESGPPAVAGVDLDLWPGEIVGLAGESGCGKTSLARAMVGQLSHVSGEVRVRDRNLLKLGGADLRRTRRSIQLACQDAGASLNPRRRVGAHLLEAGCPDPAACLARVGLTADMADRYPHQLSGGQRQRVALARNLSAAPDVLVADEITSALDKPLQQQVLDLLTAARRDDGLAILLISHDLDLLQRVCGRILVMDRGAVVEVYPTDGSSPPRHPCTLRLAAALPPRVGTLQASEFFAVPEADEIDGETGSGCPWTSGCTSRKSVCFKVLPPLQNVAPGHWVRCPESDAPVPAHFIDT